jgi:uncharacterized peroxidase-related enzyme
MRLGEYTVARSRPQRLALWMTRRLGAELDDVAKVAMRRPAMFGRPFLALVHEALRGESAWTVGERELFATVVSEANQCSFCVGTHGEIARAALGVPTVDGWADGRYGAKATATAVFLDALTRDPGAVGPEHAASLRDAGVDAAAAAEAVYIAYAFSVVNRLADSLGFAYPSERHRIRGARILRRIGYRLPGPLLR